MDISINMAPTHMDLLSCHTTHSHCQYEQCWLLVFVAIYSGNIRQTCYLHLQCSSSRLLQTTSRLLTDHVALSRIRQHSAFCWQNLTYSVIHWHAALQSHCGLFWYLSCAINNYRHIYNNTGNVCTVLHLWFICNAAIPMCILATDLEPLMFHCLKDIPHRKHSMSSLLRPIV